MPTLQQYRRRCLMDGRIGRFITASTSSTPSDGSTIVADTLADSEKPANAFDGWYIYGLESPILGQQRRVAKGTFVNSTGQLTMSRNWSTPVSSGTDLELLTPLPAVSQDGSPGWRELINEALKTCWFLDRLSIAGVTSQLVYSLTSYAWLTRRDQIGPLYGPITSASDEIPLRWSGAARLRLDADTPKLELATPVETGQTFFLDVLRPADTWIKVSGTWGDSTVGLVNESDEALPDESLVACVATAYAARALANLADPTERKVWEALYSDRLKAAAVLKHHLLPRLDRSASFEGEQEPGRVWAGIKGLWG